MAVHRKKLEINDIEAIFCDSIIKEFTIKLKELKYIINNNLIKINKNCLTCGKPLKSIIRNFCSVSCSSANKDVQDKAKQTNLKRYGVEHPHQSKEIKEKKKKTNIEKYGVEYSVQAEEVKNKRKNTNLSKYGKINVFQVEEIKDKIKNTNLERYNTEYSIQSKEIKDKVKQTNLSKYGTEFPIHNKEIKEKIKKTNLEKYGVENILQSKEIQEKIKKTNIERYGVKNSLQSKIIREKSKQTNLNNLGVEYPTQSVIIQEKIKKINIERYGVEHSSQSEEIKEKKKKTNLERLGVEYPAQSKEVRKKYILTCLEKYNSEYPVQSNIIKLKIRQTKRIKKYDFFNKLLKIKNIKLLSTYNEYLNNDNLKFKCCKCNTEFEAKYSASIQHRVLCINCYKKQLCGKSIGELELFNFIKGVYSEFDVINSSRKIIGPLELDIYIPDKKLAIEYNGIYWHNSNIKDKYYHLNKTNLCKDKDIQLLHIFETEWLYKQEIVKSIINSKLNIYENKIYARKCIIKDLPNEEYKEFLELNHIQGYISAKIKLGLFYNNELVSCIGIGKSRFKNNETELIRFCNKLNTTVIGGLSRLIKYSKVKELISYVDLRYFNGSGYEKAGFELESQSAPGYIYSNGKNILTRYQCQKHKLFKLLGDKFDKNLTEEENMLLSNYYKIYDCGMLKYRKIKNIGEK